MILILQKCLPSYRKHIFDELILRGNDIYVVYSDPREGKLRSTSVDSSDTRYSKLKLISVSFFGRQLFFQVGIFHYLLKTNLKKIIIEGESNILSSLLCASIRIFRPDVETLVWTIGYLPHRRYSGYKKLLKSLYYYMFSNVMFYSKYAFEYHKSHGLFGSSKAYYNTNITFKPPVSADMKERKALDESEIVAFYVGAWGEEKNTNFFLNQENFSGVDRLIIFSHGIPKEDMDRLERSSKISIFMGLQYQEVFKCAIREADFMILPGRGGQVVGEALINDIPVFCWSGDGTEIELINRTNGKIFGSEGELIRTLSDRAAIYSILSGINAQSMGLQASTIFVRGSESLRVSIGSSRIRMYQQNWLLRMEEWLS